MLGVCIGCRPSSVEEVANIPTEDLQAEESAATSSQVAAAEAAKIELVFKMYKVAIANSDGTQAADVMATATIEEYQHYRDWALTADKSVLSKQRVDQQRQALFYRLRLNAEQLEPMDGRALFAHAVNEEWIGKESVATLTLRDIRVAGNRAVAKVTVNGKPTTSEFDFVMEGGAWKLDLLRFSATIAERLAEQLKNDGKSIEQYLLENLSELEGESVGERVWTPLK
jgi:hypothetical protein